MNVKIKQRKWKPAKLREPTLRLFAEEGIWFGYWGACSIDPQWLIDRGFPAAFVLPMVEEFRHERGQSPSLIIKADADGPEYLVGHVRAVGLQRVLRALAQVFGADTTDDDRQGNKWTIIRMLAASIKKAITEEERIHQ